MYYFYCDCVDVSAQYKNYKSVIDSGGVSGEPKIFRYHCVNIRKIEPNIRV